MSGTDVKIKDGGPVDFTLTYNETEGKLTSASGVEITDWAAFKIRNIVATK